MMPINFKKAIENLEQDLIEQALAAAKYRVGPAALLLMMHRPLLYAKMRKYNIAINIKRDLVEGK